MYSLRIPLRAGPPSLGPGHRLWRAFGSQPILRAPPPADASSAATRQSSEAAAAPVHSREDRRPAPTPRSQSQPTQPAAESDSIAARRRRTADSLTAFINQMLPSDQDAPKPSGRRSALTKDDLGLEGPMARRQGDILRGLTRGERFAETLSAARGVGKLPPLPPPVRLDAYIARAEPVGGGVSLSRALDKLNIKLALNRVRADIRRQKFHERGGLKRKRLKRERWRRRFKEGFVATVRKVQRMKAQGW